LSLQPHLVVDTFVTEPPRLGFAAFRSLTVEVLLRGSIVSR
jgi:hypothetical protein